MYINVDQRVAGVELTATGSSSHSHQHATAALPRQDAKVCRGSDGVGVHTAARPAIHPWLCSTNHPCNPSWWNLRFMGKKNNFCHLLPVYPSIFPLLSHNHPHQTIWKTLVVMFQSLQFIASGKPHDHPYQTIFNHIKPPFSHDFL